MPEWANDDARSLDFVHLVRGGQNFHAAGVDEYEKRVDEGAAVREERIMHRAFRVSLSASGPLKDPEGKRNSLKRSVNELSPSALIGARRAAARARGRSQGPEPKLLR